MGRCIVYTGIRLLLLIHPSFLHFLSLQFSNIKSFRNTYQELWGLEGWNLVHTWTVGGCMVYTRIRLLLLIRPFIFYFFFLSNFQTLKCFCHTFLRNCGAWKVETLYRRGQWVDESCILKVFSRTMRHKRLKQYKVTKMKNKYNVSCILKSGCSYFFILFFLPFSVSPIFSLYWFIFLLSAIAGL